MREMRYYCNMKIALSCIFIICTLCIKAQSQEFETPAFKHIDLQISYNRFKGVDTEYDKYWAGGKSASFSITTPFYYGDIVGGMEYTVFEGKKKVDFQSLYVFLGWGKELKIHQRVRILPVVLIGTNVFDFSKYDPAHFQKEQEFSYGFQNTIKIYILKKWTLNLNTTYRRILTTPNIKLFYSSIGVSYRVMLGEKIRAFLL